MIFLTHLLYEKVRNRSLSLNMGAMLRLYRHECEYEVYVKAAEATTLVVTIAVGLA